jgi:hypothetical protein
MHHPIRHALTPLLLLCAFSLFAQAQPAQLANDTLQLRISSGFPGGSARVLGIDPTNNSVRITPAGDPDRGWPCWWYFRLDGVDTNQPVVLEVVANQSMVQTDNPGQKRKLSADWSLPAQAAFSTDGTTWEHTAPGERHDNRSVYRINTASSTLWLAWGPPFTLKDADQLIQRACNLCPYARSFVLARTREGRPVPGLRVSQPGAAAGQRFSVWIQARQHAWESGSSWVGRGFIEWLVSKDPTAESLRQKADIVFIPIVDVDSVERGQGGKKQVPHDQNEDWGNAPWFPEVRVGMEKLSALAKAGRLDLFLDLHNPGAGDRTIMFYIPPVPLLFPERVTNEDAFLKIVQEQMTGPILYTGKIGPCGKTYDPAVDKSVDAWVAAQSGPQVVSLTLETPWNISASTSSGYLKTGEQLGRCIDLYLRASIRSNPGK